MLLTPIFQRMADQGASDLFITSGAPIQIKINGVTQAINQQIILPEQTKHIAYELMSPEQIAVFERQKEINFAHNAPQIGSLRINVFQQRYQIALAIRLVKSVIPDFTDLHLPPILLNLVLEKRGLILAVGATGSGKSTTLAAMIDHRAKQQTGHILTIEDPIEYQFQHRKSIVNQREIYTDTHSYHAALISALREAPDLVMIGEIRDQETMQQALILSLSGQLCLSTLHANNSYHALSRITNMFPQDSRPALLADLSYALKAIISQRLIRNTAGRQMPVVEILLNSTHVSDLILKGEIGKIKDAIEQSLYPGSQTFEQALCQLCLSGHITQEEALANADSPTNLSWLLNQAGHAPSSKKTTPTPKVATATKQAADFINFQIDVKKPE